MHEEVQAFSAARNAIPSYFTSNSNGNGSGIATVKKRSSRARRRAVADEVLAPRQGRVVVHYLPAYAPQTNSIERVWWHLHEEVTRNHRCPTMTNLLGMVRDWMATDATFPIESTVYADLRMAA